MAKTMELQFLTDSGAIARVSVDNPKEPIDPVAVKQSMDQIILAGAFTTANGNLAAVKGARVVERNVTDYEIA
ncbi:DUF2922 domain-containing protein [Bacillus canaveralius]|uniref:DUF2922 domain-containing protein n=1 Tax=Bacillus canaveralius TaxID=1403243 RepID=A0A2N5GGI7_9BACI|nr:MULTISPECIES: DUF2922 domain-containing protein [Bacillus]PLR79853.1 DUF2922 domain-containing protein [Bacillus canaveralius]PLR87177.1 DUF2922 domain-containing protein [Bacillus sp. V33-4]PLR97798.1 DUF2922 domain-containing protein [Bacillus canaveralius]RSK45563.1 DUF2922 domain-containing protein [Bacillus canaveralius]